MKNIIVKAEHIFPILLILGLWLSSCTKQPQYGDSYIIQKDGLFGLIDSLGKEIVTPKYIYIEPIRKDGVALAVIDTIYTSVRDSSFLGIRNIPILNIKYGYITSKDKFLFPEPSYVKIRIEDYMDSIQAYSKFCQEASFYGGLAIAQDTTTFLYGYIGLDGDTIIPPKFREAHRFNDGRAAVQLDSKNGLKGSGKWGLIDPEGKNVCDFVFNHIETPVNGRAIASIMTINKEEGGVIEGEIGIDKNGNAFIDKTKATVIEASDDPIYSTTIFLVDDNGKVIKEDMGMTFQYSNFNKDGIAVAIPNRLAELFGRGYRFIKKDGEFLKPIDVTSITEEQAQKIIESKYFLNEMLPEDIEFADASRFTDGYAAVNLGRAWIFVDSQLIPRGNEEHPIYEDALPFSYGLAGVKLKGKYGYIDKEFNITIPCKYDSCAIAGRNLCRVYSGKRTQSGFSIVSYINKQNEIVWQNIDYQGDFFEKSEKKQNGIWKEGISYVYIGKDYTIVWILLTLFTIAGISYWAVIQTKRRNRNNAKSSAKNIETIFPIKESNEPDSSKLVLAKENVGTNTPDDISEDKNINDEEKKAIDERLNDILGF
ncbi:MAG: WG repeat-containing protein [Muribaculaceae bacterium]|nr:WG repeat-containing protein [Muribaculaceae bacterium]